MPAPSTIPVRKAHASVLQYFATPLPRRSASTPPPPALGTPKAAATLKAAPVSILKTKVIVNSAVRMDTAREILVKASPVIRLLRTSATTQPESAIMGFVSIRQLKEIATIPIPALPEMHANSGHAKAIPSSAMPLPPPSVSQATASRFTTPPVRVEARAANTVR